MVEATKEELLQKLRAYRDDLRVQRQMVRAKADQGVWMAMKGKHPVDEIAALPSSVKVFHVEQLEVPGLGAERCIVWIRRSLPG